ncbi:MAG: Crp/Fnr family transcriptional regulator [Oscillospiraceae bacterium]|nr:Crp/Fnr family transcriptional regulator [Oscillospiraceae bacterium]
MPEFDESIDIYSVGRYWFTQEEAEKLMVGSRTIRLKKGEVLYRAEEGVRLVYYLREGTTKFHMLYPDGTSRTTAYSTAPGFVSIVNVLPGHLTINNCTAVTSCVISAVPTDTFMDRVREYGLMEKLFQYAIGTTRHIYTSLTALLTEDRVHLVDTLRNQQHLTLQEVADFIGCSRVHVSRLCKQIEEQKEPQEEEKKSE